MAERRPIPVPILSAGRWSLVDLWDFVARGEQAPQPSADNTPPPDADPLTALRAHVEGRGLRFVDFRGWERNKRYDPKVYGYSRDGTTNKRDGRAWGTRPWSKVTAIMLHCTGTGRGSMWPERFLGVPCHVGISGDADVTICHPLNAKVHHGNGGNGFSVGLEIAGHSSDQTPEQIETARAVVRYCVDEIRWHRGADASIAVMAHRQATKDRPVDPGRTIWQGVAMWAMDELGLKLGPVVGGQPIPDKWTRPDPPAS